MAQSNLGLMYKFGLGVNQDYRAAFNWIRKAAEQGYAKAQNNLGVSSDSGQGVTQDYVQDHKWHNIAGANGEESGRKNRGIIEKLMTSEQIAKAQKLAREWMEKHPDLSSK